MAMPPHDVQLALLYSGSTAHAASIKRAEPAADLFKVPEGYTVKGRDPHGAAPEARAPHPPG
jgi:hypothetical protein